ncbi:MAG: hypothetical protein NTV60_02860 [Candidatus Kaiserbacteria bacterium]|nr:hypothetical protein [Candidatus Kaiserbacteria bacterium]
MKTVIITRSSREAICIVQLKKEKLIGFAWGYKIPADQELESFGIKTRRILEGDYFFIERIFIEPHSDWPDTGRKLIEQILSIQTCREVLLRVKRPCPAFELVSEMGGMVVWPILRGTWAFMQITIKK